MSFSDDFNRTGPSLGSDYYDVTDLEISGNELVAAAGTWGEAYLIRVFPSPLTIQFDLWVPPDPFDWPHAFQVEGGTDNLALFINNSNPEAATHWAFYPPGSSASTFLFPVTADTWITVKAELPSTDGEMIRFKYWDQGDTEPVGWDWEEARVGTVTDPTETYVYLDASDPGFTLYPTKIDNLIIFSDPFTFTADAVLSPTTTSFTDFTTDFGDWSGTGALYVDSGELVADPGVSDSLDFDGDNTMRTGFARFDVWIPPVTDDGYHAYELDVFQIYAYMDNWMFTDYAGPSTTWGIYHPNGDIYYFDPEPDTWYRVFMYVDNVNGGGNRTVIWKRDDPIPDNWDLRREIPGQWSYIWTLYVDADNNDGPQSTYASRVDNVLVYESSDDPFAVEDIVDGSFTADAMLRITHANNSNPTVTTGYVSTAVAGSASVAILVNGKSTVSAPGFDDQLGFITLSIDSNGFDVVINAPDGWDELIRSELPDLDHILVTYVHRWKNSEPNTVLFTWTGARSVVAGAWTVTNFPITTPPHHLHITRVEELTPNSTYTTAIRGFTSSLIKGAGWSGYTAFAGASAGTWSTVSSSSQFIDASTTWASLALNRDDGNTVQAMPDYLIAPSNAQPTLGHLIVVESDTTFFRADAVFFNYTFTANAAFLAVQGRAFTADSRFVITEADDFTADAFIQYPTTFKASAVLKAPDPILGITTPYQMKKLVTMKVLDRIERAKDTYVPPRVPDQENEDPTPPESVPRCLPPCAGTGAGGDINGWGSFKKSFTYCSECNVYFRTDSEILGQGSAAIDGNYHCGCTSEHNRDAHVTRLFVDYPQIPEGDFRLRAKMSWDINGPDALIVVARTIPAMPEGDTDECSDLSDVWNSGGIIGNFTFNNDASSYGAVILGETQVKYQKEPDQLVVTKGNLTSSVMMFHLALEDENLNARFRAANLEWA